MECFLGEHEGHEEPQRDTKGDCQCKEPQITQIWADLGPATAGRTASVFWESQRTQRTQRGGAGAGRACAQGARPARGPGGTWRASHAMLWFLGESSGVSPAGLIFHERPSVTLSPRRGAPFSVAVEGLRLRRYTLRSLFSGARQRPLSYRSYRVAFQSANQRGGNAVPSVSSPPRAVIRALTSVAPPCLQTSKLPISGAR